MKSTFNSEVFLRNVSEHSVQIENWSRDTGHSWQQLYVREQTPTDKDLSFADHNRTFFVKIADLSLEQLLKLIWEIEKC